MVKKARLALHSVFRNAEKVPFYNHIDAAAKYLTHKKHKKRKLDLIKIRSNSPVLVLKGLINHLADRLATHYATVVTKTVTSSLVLKITNVNQENDFTHILHYFQHLPQVASVETQQIEGSELELKINIRGSRESLMKIISVGKKLTPVSGVESNLVYKWNS